MQIDPKQRFTDRVGDYVKFRPSYPVELVNYLSLQGRPLRVADIGSGTGLFAKLLLEAGHEVYGVEPNSAMRAAGEKFLVGFPLFHSQEGGADWTGLPSGEFDLITAAQAFHWFDVQKTKRECQRILKPEGRVALIWNGRETKSEFGKAFDAFNRKFANDDPFADRNWEEIFHSFFGGEHYESLRFDYSQTMDWEAFWGRFQSVSYSPKPDHPNFEPARAALKNIYVQYAENGFVKMVYETELFYGTIRD
jgi:SAM-dependent methyltransferase